MIKRITKSIVLLMVLLASSITYAQVQTPLDIALRHLETQHAAWGLEHGDIQNMLVNDQFTTKHNGVTHVYLMQQYQGIEIHNGLININILPNGEVLYVGNNLVNSLAEKVNTTSATLTEYDAIIAAATHLEIPVTKAIQLKKREGNRSIFEGGEISNSDITVQQKYAPVFNSNGDLVELRLAWDLAIDQKDNADYYTLRMDAVTGELVDKHNYTVYCKLEKHGHLAHEKCTSTPDFQPITKVQEEQNMLFDSVGAYVVFAIPNESPNHGERERVVNPADPEASPFGWHDTNGVEGAEYTITRGNNVHAFLDLNDSNSSAGDEPDGGAELNFDYPFIPLGEPDTNANAAVTQLFYMNNIIHDFCTSYGFDEAAGNFQENNYGRGGSGNDAVEANAQDGGSTNNANFSSPPDGNEGRMQMYTWNRSGLLTVDEPANIAGIYETGMASFGPDISLESATPVTGEVMIMDDGTADATLGCFETNQDLTGKVALIDRGGCFFDEKILNAQNAGAIGVLVCDFSGGGLGGMGAGSAAGPQVTIPSLSLSFSDCQTVRSGVGAPLIVTMGPPDDQGPEMLDGDFDNGIIAHEYGHGISIRLTGGRFSSACLSNDEQMGEGWSDFFTLAMTAKPGDTGAERRGVGSYVQQQPTDGAGIRRFPYSTDLDVNPQSFNDIIGTTSPHALGEIWSGMLWQLYWTLVDEYGFDEDLYHGTGGNNIAIQLVFDGMKLQGCNPGFIAGRDAILAADEANNGGANRCLIWKAFALRGLGWDADGRNANNRNDGREGYELPPTCIPELKLTKTATPIIEAGDNIEYTLTVINDKAEALEVTITDELPENTVYIAGSASMEAIVDGNMISFEIGTVEPGELVRVSYEVQTPADQFSIRQFYDDVEDGDEAWEFDARQGTDIWDITTDASVSGEASWFVPATANDNDQLLQIARPFEITGDKPVLRFAHQFDTEWGFDGGIVEVSRDGFQWERLAEGRLFREGYETQLAYTTFAIANLDCFAGSSDGWVTTYIDLSDYAGESIFWRYRFGTVAEAEGTAADGIGWYVDDIELMDMKNYETTAVATSTTGDRAIAIMEGRGTVVETALPSNVNTFNEEVSIEVFPNPAGDLLNVAISNLEAKDINITLVTVDGKEVMSQTVNTYGGQELVPFNVSSLAEGFYFVKVSSDSETAVEKIVIK